MFSADSLSVYRKNVYKYIMLRIQNVKHHIEDSLHIKESSKLSFIG